MEIRKEKAWCPTCTAPEVWPVNVPLVELYLQALPTWRTPEAGRLQEGFDRSELRDLMTLRGIPAAEQTETWTLLAALEAQTREIRALKREEAKQSK
jgi:hypothetical protein